MISGLPFDDIRHLVRDLPGPNQQAAEHAADIASRFEAIAGGLGRAGALAEWLAAWTGRRPPRVSRPVVALFAGTHGVAANAGGNDGVRRLVERCAAGGGAVNQACIAGDLGLKIFDLALDMPTGDITSEAALDERSAAATIAFGMEAVAGGTDLLVLGGYGGEGGMLAATAVLAALHSGGGAAWMDEAGPGRAALELHAGHLKDPLEALRRVGGREIAALVGAIVAARIEKVAVILDGMPALAAAATVRALAPDGIAHCVAGDCSSHVADHAITALGLEPLLRLGMTTGDAAGGAIAAGIVKAAALAHAGAAEFLAGVDRAG